MWDYYLRIGRVGECLRLMLRRVFRAVSHPLLRVIASYIGEIGGVGTVPDRE